MTTGRINQVATRKSPGNLLLTTRADSIPFIERIHGPRRMRGCNPNCFHQVYSVATRARNGLLEPTRRSGRSP